MSQQPAPPDDIWPCVLRRKPRSHLVISLERGQAPVSPRFTAPAWSRTNAGSLFTSTAAGPQVPHSDLPALSPSTTTSQRHTTTTPRLETAGTLRDLWRSPHLLNATSRHISAYQPTVVSYQHRHLRHRSILIHYPGANRSVRQMTILIGVGLENVAPNGSHHVRIIGR